MRSAPHAPQPVARVNPRTAHLGLTLNPPSALYMHLGKCIHVYTHTHTHTQI